MLEFSIKLEAIALVLMAILALFHFGGQSRTNMRSRMFGVCLLLAFGSTILDIATMFTILDVSLVPLWFNNLLNELYFLVMDICMSFVAVYAFYVMFEHAADKHCFYIASGFISAMCLFLIGTVVANIWTGCLFYFENGVYTRGVLNRVAYVVLLIEVCMLCACYLRNRHVVSIAMRKLIQLIPPLAVLFALIELLVPDILLNGTMAAMILLVFYINFQSNRIFQDSLTELPNRSMFCRELSLQRKKGQKLHLIMIHLENFDGVNRKYGMTRGDEVIYEVARFLNHVAPEYQAFRFGNTRFVLMARYNGEKDAQRCVNEIQRYFSEPLESLYQEYVLRVRIGHMMLEDSKLDENSVVDQLEYAVSGMKELSGTTLVYFDDRVREMFQRKEYILKMMRKALEEETFQVYYQPVYDCESGGFSSAESLLRLFGEQGEMISPAEFIPLAEENGMIDEISWLVLKKVCRFLGAYPDIAIRTVSVNMSVQQLENHFFAQKVKEMKDKYGVLSERLRIEITERATSENPDLVHSVMGDMAKDGIRFYLDDFGIGYSNLANLFSLPFEIVKLDASLINGIKREDNSYEAARLLVEMIHCAGFQVVAEGIETQEQAEMVKNLKIDRIQGYYYSRPVPEEQLIAFITDK